MKSLTTGRLEKFVRKAGERLKGDWLILGGCVLPLLGVPHRVTVDLDIVGPMDATLDQNLVLLELARELGLPPEAINQAAALFLRRVKGWDQRTVLVHEGTSARIYRPDCTLYLLLKMDRLSETDLSDCLAMLEHCRKSGEPVHAAPIRKAIRSALKANPSEAREVRLKALLQAA